MKGFEYTVGTTVGKDHRSSGRNNQDAYYVIDGDDFFIGVVADGCGEGAYSEVGARLGSRLMAENLWKFLSVGGKERINSALTQTATELENIAFTFNDRREFMRTSLLFTLVGVVIVNSLAHFFALGDGHIVVNDMMFSPKFKDNMPPYLAYTILDPQFKAKPNEYVLLPIDELDTWLIATDGLDEYLASKDKLVPGKKHTVGPLSNLWQDRYYENPDNLNRDLRLMNRELVRLDKDSGEIRHIYGHLSDDTTIIAGRRSPVDDSTVGQQETDAQPL